MSSDLDQIGRLGHRVPFVITEEPKAPQYPAHPKTGHLAGCMGLCVIFHHHQTRDCMFIHKGMYTDHKTLSLVVNITEILPACVAPLGFPLLQ